MKNYYFLILLFSLLGQAYTQTDTTEINENNLKISGFLDVFYSYDFGQPEGESRYPFFFSHNRHNEINVNVGLIKLEIARSKYRANLALQTGTYAIDNYAAEPVILQSIFEASVGFSLNKAQNLWLDAGVFPSHIGFESAITSDNITLSRSLMAENSPYFLTGAKLTYQPMDQWQFLVVVSNGWQRIRRVGGNSLLSWGTQVVYTPSDKLSFNWSTFIGTDDPDSTRRMRYFNDLYTIAQLSPRLTLMAGLDFGIQQTELDSDRYDSWLGASILMQIKLSEQWNTGLRWENFLDETGIIIPTTVAGGFKVNSFSANLDYLPTENLVWRIEGRWLGSPNSLFMYQGAPSNQNFSLLTSLAIKLK